MGALYNFPAMHKTPLDSLHRELGARMAPFAGYAMPIQYPKGIINEHRHTRAAAGLFDVSHMGQVAVRGAGAAAALETLAPMDALGLEQDAQAYTLLTNERGGVLDDLIVGRRAGDEWLLVVNAACKAQDVAHLQAGLAGCEVELLEDRALLALQGPQARPVLRALAPAAANLPFMRGAACDIAGHPAYITCSGYTGEDGFEISIAADAAAPVARSLLAREEVEPAGLGARDSLRLEAGLCLYGHELNEDTTPVAAGLNWAIAKARRPGGERPGGFPGADRIFQEQQEGTPRRLAGLRVEGRRPARASQAMLNPAGNTVGAITSACFAPTVEAPIAMAYIDSELAKPDTALKVDARGTLLQVQVSRLPFVPRNYYRG